MASTVLSLQVIPHTGDHDVLIALADRPTE